MSYLNNQYPGESYYGSNSLEKLFSKREKKELSLMEEIELFLKEGKFEEVKDEPKDILVKFEGD